MAKLYQEDAERVQQRSIFHNPQYAYDYGFDDVQHGRGDRLLECMCAECISQYRLWRGDAVKAMLRAASVCFYTSLATTPPNQRLQADAETAGEPDSLAYKALRR